MAKIFISYRRQDTGGHAGRLRDDLDEQFGDLVFQDVDSIPDGAVFETVLASALSSAKVGVVVIGPNWLTSTDTAGRRRLDDPKDWVRTEIRALLQQNIPVIPVLVGGVRTLDADALPDDLKPLAGRQIRVLSDESWRSGVDARAPTRKRVRENYRRHCNGRRLVLLLREKRGHQRIRVSMPHGMLRLEQRHQLHVLERPGAFQYVHPMRNGLAVRLLDGRKVRRGTFDLGSIGHLWSGERRLG